jgi:cell division protein FtsB
MQLIKKQEVQDKKMAVNDSDNEELLKTNCTLNKLNFQFHYVIGKGGFGKVWKVEMKKNR